MARHHPDLIMCRKQPGIAIGRLCGKCEYRSCMCRRPVACVRACRRTTRSDAVLSRFSASPVHATLPGDGKCVVCDSYVSPCTLVRICDECNYGSYAGRCVICGNRGISDAYYCTECTKCEKDVRAGSGVGMMCPSCVADVLCCSLVRAERRMSQDCQPGDIQDRPVL